MTRRNVDPTKYRKQFHFRKCKFAEGVYSSNTFLYLKFLLLWIAIMVADYMLEFRFEFLWPFWLVIRSLNDSFKYQGIVFSIFFALVVCLSDLLFYMFLPVQWLFFAASTYVWVQYVWHTEKGVCLSTISLWLLFVYIEASVRLKSLKSIELCRPFAAHCIGFPIVTLAFGFKNYLSYKLRLRRQREIQKSNEFHLELIAKALPLELQLKDKKKFKALNYEDVSSQQLCSSGGADNSQSAPSAPSANAFYQNKDKAAKSSFEDLPYIQQKDIPKSSSSSSSSSSSGKASFGGEKGSGNTFSKSFFNFNSGKNKGGQQHHQQQHQHHHGSSSAGESAQASSSSSSINCNLSSFSISSLAYTATTTSGSDQQSSSSSGQTNLLLLPAKVDKSSMNGEHHHHHRSSSSSSANSSTTTTAFLPSSSNNHTNININMTINATAIAAATATATANGAGNNGGTQTSPLSSSSCNSKGGQAAANGGKGSASAASEAGANGVVNSSGPSSKKYKNNKETHRANSASCSSNSPNESQRQSSSNGSPSPSSSSDFKDELILKLEEDLKKLRLEIDQQKKVEQYLRTQINYITKCDRTEKLKLEKLQQENETLQAKITKMATQKQKEKDELSSLEKRYQEEKRARFALETQLAQEKKQREELERQSQSPLNGQLKTRNAAAHQTASSPPPAYASVVSNATSSHLNAENGLKSGALSTECGGELCKKRQREFENELKVLSDECRKKQERILMLECEMKTMMKYRDTESKVDTLMAAVKLMENKNASLQESLSAETRFKMDLFSALGETRRQLDSVLIQLENKEREVVQLNDAFKCIFKSVTNGAINMNNSSELSNLSQLLPSQGQQHLPGMDGMPSSLLNGGGVVGSGAGSSTPPTSAPNTGTCTPQPTSTINNISSTINGANKVSNGGIN